MKQKQTKAQAGFTKAGVCVVSVILAVAVAVLGPIYVGQLEQTRAMSMQAMLINVLIGQESYRAKNGTYTDSWQAVLPYVAQPEILEPQLQAIAGQAQNYFFGFGKNAAKKQVGYIVSLQLSEDKQSGTLRAQRSKNWFYKYALKRDFPDGELLCVSERGAKHFCARLLNSTDALELKNLTPAKEQEPARS